MTTVKLKIKYRLFLAILAATGAVVISMFIIIQWSIGRGFLRYVNTIEQTRMELLAGELEDAFATHGNWNFLRDNPRQFVRLMVQTLPEEHIDHKRMKRIEKWIAKNSKPSPPPDALPPRLGRHFELRVILLDALQKPVYGTMPKDEKVDFKSIKYNGTVVGYLGLLPRKHLSDDRQLRFIKQQKEALALVAGAILLISAAISLPLANRLVRPLKRLAAATHRLASGRFDTRVAVDSSDEVGQLARDFNTLALTLEKNEEARRQWVADISHELRTPISVLRGEIEAIQDGLREPTPEAIQSLHGEIMRLSRLVDDLYQLSLSDVGALTYRKEELNLPDILMQAIDPFRADFAHRNIDLDLKGIRERLTIFGDRQRLRQLFDNLLGNTLKYTDPGGRLDIRLERIGNLAVIHFQDSSPGVPEADLAKLFDRLYRVESSRSRQTGGAGLGLAICRNIVEAHEGSISALPSPHGGLGIKIELPLAGEKA